MSERPGTTGTPRATIQLDEHTAALIAQSVERTLSEIGQAKEVMSPEEAAEFLRMPYSEFRRLAPKLPRHAISERKHVYVRGELLRWLMER